VAETRVKRLLCCRFQHTGKAMGQVYKCWWGLYREINVFSRFEYRMFYVLYAFMTYLPTASSYYTYFSFLSVSCFRRPSHFLLFVASYNINRRESAKKLPIIMSSVRRYFILFRSNYHRTSSESYRRRCNVGLQRCTLFLLFQF
jgi:hypothetical protein